MTNGDQIREPGAPLPGSRLSLPAIESANLDLASGRLDIILADSLVIYEWMKTDDGKDFEFVGPNIEDSEVFGAGEGIATRKEDAHLRDMLDQAILDILADGTYDKINAKYFPFSIY